MYCHYIGWCIGKCPLYRGVLYSECPLSEVPLYIHVAKRILRRKGCQTYKIKLRKNSITHSSGCVVNGSVARAAF